MGGDESGGLGKVGGLGKMGGLGGTSGSGGVWGGGEGGGNLVKLYRVTLPQ